MRAPYLSGRNVKVSCSVSHEKYKWIGGEEETYKEKVGNLEDVIPRIPVEVGFDIAFRRNRRVRIDTQRFHCHNPNELLHTRVDRD